MGFLKLFAKPVQPLLQLPSGSFTVDRSGHILVTTIPSSVSRELVHEIARRVLETFRDAQVAQLPLSELIVDYPGFKICAREMRGGAMVFLSPKTLTGAFR